MGRKRIVYVAAAAVSILAAGGYAHAQMGSTAIDVTGLHKADDDAMMIQPFNLSVDDLEDLSIVSTAGDEVGEVENVLLDGSGKPVAVSAEVGGFLGVGAKDVVIGLDQLQQGGEHLTIDMTKEQIEALPEWDD